MKKLLIAIAVIIILVIIAAVVAPFVIPVDAYKAKLIAAVKQSTGRDLRIDGPVSFHILPSLELSADQVSLSNAPGGIAKNMAQLKSLEVRLQLLPLLSGTVAIDSFVLVNPVIALEIEKDGRPNWQFSATAAPPPASTAAARTPAGAGAGAMTELARLHIARLKIKNGAVSYVDAQTGKHWQASSINMDLALPGLDQPMAASGSGTWNGQTVNLDLAVDRPEAFEGGRPTPIKLKIASPMINFSFTGTGVGAPTTKLDGNADLDIPSLRKLAAWAGRPMPAGNGFGPLAIKGKVSIAGRKYNFGNATIAFDAIKGNGGIDFDDTGGKPYIKGSLRLDDLNLNPYLGAPSGPGAASKPATSPSSASSGSASSAAQGWSTAPIDTAPLKVVNADFFLGANSLEYHNIKIGKSALILHLKDAQLTAYLTQLSLYKGSGQGKVTIDGSGAVPRIQESFALKGVDMQPLLHDAADVNLLSGSGNIDMTINGRGRSQHDIIASLDGKGSLHLDRGKIEGVNIIGIMKNAAKALSMGLVGSGNNTDFSTLSGTFTITNGVLKNNDLQLESAELPMTGAGTIDLPRRQVDYRLTPKVAGAIAVPVLITGPWDHLSYRPDIGAMLKEPGTLLQQPGKPLKNLEKALPGTLQNLFK